MLSLTSPSASYTTQSLSSSALATSTRNSAGGCTHLAAFHKLESFFFVCTLATQENCNQCEQASLQASQFVCIAYHDSSTPPKKDRPSSHLVRRVIPSAVQSSCAVCRLETLLLESGAEGEKKSSDSHFRPAIGNGPAPYSQ